MNFLNSIRTLLLALVLSIGISYAYAAWAPPSTTPTGGNTDAPINVGSATQLKDGGLGLGRMGSPALLDVVGNLVVSGNVGIGTASLTEKLEVDGNVKVTGSLQAPTLCLSGDCKSAWPVASGSVDWSSITNRPAGLDDGDDVGAQKDSTTVVRQCPMIDNRAGSCWGGTCVGQITTGSSCVGFTSYGGEGECIWQNFNCDPIGRYFVQ